MWLASHAKKGRLSVNFMHLVMTHVRTASLSDFVGTWRTPSTTQQSIITGTFLTRVRIAWLLFKIQQRCRLSGSILLLIEAAITAVDS